MQKTLTRHGNGYALVIEKPIPELLMSDGQCLVLTPVRDASEEKKFQKSLEDIHTRSGRAMKRLAEQKGE